MLLTGYDAPILGAMYLDKPLKEHNLLQGLARVNRTRSRKKAGLIVDYHGISQYLIQALEIFSGDLRIEEVIAEFAEEFPRLEQRHHRLLEFFKPVKTDRKYKQKAFINEAVLFLEPIDVRDEFKDHLKKFNESMAIVMPHPDALKFKDDFKLFNTVKLEARTNYPDDDQLKVSTEESQKLKDMIDEHLHANGVNDLLEEPVSIIDRKKFEEELHGHSDKSKELKMVNRTKHTIKVGMDQNPDFYKPLSQRLEELLEERRANRITQLELFRRVEEEVLEPVRNQNKQAESMGFSEAEFAVYNSLKVELEDTAEELTRAIFVDIEPQLQIVEWYKKTQVIDDLGKRIRKHLRGKVEKPQVKELSYKLVDLLLKTV